MCGFISYFNFNKKINYNKFLHEPNHIFTEDQIKSNF